ncbi:MAG TPA: C39 family peptidase [Gemmatimonadales bacterium]|nr:C39 family peptidase [Gemmatimonadales bacterium]
MSRQGKALAVLGAGLIVSTALHAQTARGDLIDGIDVERRGSEALIDVRFNVPIAYVGHSPAASGATLRIYPGLTGAAASATRGELRLPKTDMIPRFTVTYPEPDNALVIRFDRPTRFEVHPSARSIAISIPVLPGAKDWVVVTNDWSVKRIDAAAVKAALAASPVELSGAMSQSAEQAPPSREPSLQSTVQIVGFAGGGNGMFSLPVDSLKQVRFYTVVRQHQDWSCGSAAIATLLTYHYNYPITEQEVLEAMYAHGNQKKIRKEGFSMLDMKRFLDSLGYRANGFQTSLERLAHVKVPAIVIIHDRGYDHFVVVKGLRGDNVLLGDPARGNRVLSRAAFDAMWRSRILFVITARHDGVAFNGSQDWRFMAAPLGDAVSRDSLAAMLLARPPRSDF